jgi:hypothetical protein
MQNNLDPVCAEVSDEQAAKAATSADGCTFRLRRGKYPRLDRGVDRRQRHYW